MSTSARTWPILRRVFKLGLVHPGAVVLMMLSMGFLGAMSASLVWAFDDVLRFFGSDPNHSDPTQAARIVSDLQRTAWYLLVLVPVSAAAAYVSWYTSQWLANRCMLDLRRQVVVHLLDLDMGFHSQLAKGDLLARVSGDMERTQALLSGLYGTIQQRPWEILGSVVMLALIEWRLTLVVYGALIPILLILGRNFTRVRRRSHTARDRLSGLLIAFEQIAAGIRVIKTCSDGEREAQRFDALNQSLLNANMRVAKSRASTDAWSYGLTFGLLVAMIGGGPWLCRLWEISPSVLGVFLAALLRIMQLLRTLQRAIAEMLERVTSAARVFELLDTKPALVDAPNALVCPPPRQALCCEDLSFRYSPEAEAVIEHLTLEIPVGRTVALVGESGAGKSTLLDLILRLHEPSAGRITVDGVDLRALSQASWRQHCAFVQQDPFLFNDTVQANIAFGRPGATAEEVEQAARRAHVHEAILGLEGGLGYQTLVGERGERLSGGQRQRVAIARALLRDAPVLLLDEPTSALDAESEQHVQAALDELMRGRTVIVVAHRLATIQHADIIHVFSKERRGMVESGSHSDLLARDGIYARMVRLQQLDR